MQIVIITPRPPTDPHPLRRRCRVALRRLRRGMHRLLTSSRAAVQWCRAEFAAPALCLSCVYVGVLSTMLLPSALLPVPSGVVLSPLAALPIAVSVVDMRAHKRWAAARQARLGLRMLRACNDGITWWWWWRRQA